MDADIHMVVGELNAQLGATMVAALSGTRDSKRPYEWAARTSVPDAEEEDRLRFALDLWCQLVEADGADVARTWFRGANPVLNEKSAVLAIREGHFPQVREAARAFMAGTWSA